MQVSVAPTAEHASGDTHASDAATSPRVSVILPTFNRATSLIAAARSVLQQSYRDLELIIVDDGSQEDIAAVAGALSDARVRYVRREQRGGSAAARNTGLAQARGAFIAFQDSDDLWLPGKLHRQVELLERYPEQVGAVFGWKIVYGRDQTHRYGVGRVACAPTPNGILRLDEDQVERFLNGNRISIQNGLFRRNGLPTAAWFDPCAKADDDWEFAARLVQYRRVCEHPDVVVLAFISSDSISTMSKKKVLGLIRIAKKNQEAFSRYPGTDARHRMKIARMLWKCGKRKYARDLVISTIRKYPMCGFEALRYLQGFLYRRMQMRA